MATEIIQRFSLHSKEKTLYFCLKLSMLNNKKSLPSLIRYTMHNNFNILVRVSISIFQPTC